MKMKPQIVNIINFVRALEPRIPELDMVESVVNQVKLLEKYDLPGTFLLQYDALLKKEFTNILLGTVNQKIEIGGWLEIVQPLVEKAGLEWKGRPGYAWDWHANVGFSVGYTPEERELLVDIFMEDFRSIIGYYPASVGSWLIDAHTLAYLSDKYKITSSCCCRDQWGTDGYTFWGGYYSQGYYPCRKNVLSPAQTREEQIDLPVFRMLGSDPIYQYDAGLNIDGMGAVEDQPCITLEPIYKEGGGGSPEWVRWFFRENFNGKCLSYAYTQIGQESSFGWKRMKDGLLDQLAFVAEKVACGELQVETLRNTGKWFCDNYIMTPPSAVIVHSDWKNQGHRTVWYNCKNYRANFLWEGNKFWIRDIHIFNEKYEERYLKKVCESEYFIYDNLPVIDGNRWSGGNIRAGVYPVSIATDGTATLLEGGEPEVVEKNNEELMISWPVGLGNLTIITKPELMIFVMDHNREQARWGMQMVWNPMVKVSLKKVIGKTINYEHNHFSYNVAAELGQFQDTTEEGSVLLLPDQDEIRVILRQGIRACN